MGGTHTPENPNKITLIQDLYRYFGKKTWELLWSSMEAAPAVLLGVPSPGLGWDWDGYGTETGTGLGLS